MCKNASQLADSRVAVHGRSPQIASIFSMMEVYQWRVMKEEVWWREEGMK